MTTGEIFGGAETGVSTSVLSRGLATSALAQYTGGPAEIPSPQEAA